MGSSRAPKRAKPLHFRSISSRVHRESSIMKLNFYFSILALARLTLSHPGTRVANNRDDPVPYGAFPSSTPYPSVTLPVIPTVPSPDSHVSRVGQAIIYNSCPFPVYVWSVGSTIRPETTVPRWANFTETFRVDRQTGGIALKVTTVDGGLFNSSPQTVFAYNVDETTGSVYYDLTDVFGDPFQGHPVSLLPSDPMIFWPNGTPPGGSNVRVKPLTQDLKLSLC